MGSEHKNEQYNLRLPTDLKVFLAEEAKKDGRSLNNFIVTNLEKLKLKLQESAKAWNQQAQKNLAIRQD